MPIDPSVPNSNISIPASASTLKPTKQTEPTGKKGSRKVAISDGDLVASKDKSSDSKPKNKSLKQMAIKSINNVKNHLSLISNKRKSLHNNNNATSENRPQTAAKRTKNGTITRPKSTRRSCRPKTATEHYHQKVEAPKRNNSYKPINRHKVSSPQQQSIPQKNMGTSTKSLVKVEQQPFPKEQFIVWNQAINTMKQEPQKAIDYLFKGVYCEETADSQFDELLKDKTSNLSVFMDRMESTWQRTATPEHMGALRSNMEAKLKLAWKRMSMGDTYKLQMVAESLCLQPGGGHHQSPELKHFVQNMEKTVTDFRDGMIYDGTNAINADTPQGEVTRSHKKVVAVESTYRGVSGSKPVAELKNSDIEPGTIRNTTNSPDITLSNLGNNSEVHVELVINKADGTRLKDSVAFSDGTYSFHGASVEMEVRDQKIASQLDNGEFADRISAYANHNLDHGRNHEDLAITGDANLCLFDDNEATGERTLKPSVQEILDSHHLALVVPSGQVTWGRPISDQLHKNAKSMELDGYRDTMLLMVPVTEENLETIKQLGNNPALKQDTFFPTTMIGGKNTETTPIIHRLKSERKQFSLDFSDRVMTDHAILTGPNHIVGNTADCKGVGTPGKSLTYDSAKTVWANNPPTTEQYYQMMLHTAEELASTFNLIEHDIPLCQGYKETP